MMSTADLAPGMPDAPPWLVTDLQPDEVHREPEPGPCGCDARRREVVYTLHFDPPYTPGPDAPRYKQAAHYTGTALEARLAERLAEHEAGQGARLTQVQREAGGSWRVASVEPGGHARERQLKHRGASRRCPICKAEAQAAPEPELEPEMELEAGAMTLDPEARAVLARLAAEQRAHAEAERQADAEIAADIAAENAHAIEVEGALEAEYDREPEPEL